MNRLELLLPTLRRGTKTTSTFLLLMPRHTTIGGKKTTLVLVGQKRGLYIMLFHWSFVNQHVEIFYKKRY